MSKAVQLKDDNENVYPCPYYPVGSIYISINNINPATFFGGIWERFSNGRVLVGVDENQSEFNQVSKTGGSKYLQSHSHSIYEAPLYWVEMQDGGAVIAEKETTSIGVTHNTGATGNGNSQNLQPYITVYMWLRKS